MVITSIVMAILIIDHGISISVDIKQGHHSVLGRCGESTRLIMRNKIGFSFTIYIRHPKNLVVIVRYPLFPE